MTNVYSEEHQLNENPEHTITLNETNDIQGMPNSSIAMGIITCNGRSVMHNSDI